MVYKNLKYSNEKWDSIKKDICSRCEKKTFYKRRRKFITKKEFQEKSYIFHEYWWCSACRFMKMIDSEKIYIRDYYYSKMKLKI